MSYNYKEGKKRVLDILNDTNDVEEVSRIPTDQSFTYDNGYYGWVTAIFVDIRNSTKLFSENKKTSTAKIVRCFTSEIIEILSADENLREIGIRGDCVYAIFTTKNKSDDLEILDKAFYVNTYLKMLNALLSKKSMNSICAGIGIATHKELVIKAGKKGSGISNKVWIGKAVTHASKLSNMANKVLNEPILMTGEFYNSVIELYIKSRSNYRPDWFKKYSNNEFGVIYGCELYKSDFDNWIDGGMK